MFAFDCSGKYRAEIIARNISVTDGDSMDNLPSDFV